MGGPLVEKEGRGELLLCVERDEDMIDAATMSKAMNERMHHSMKVLNSHNKALNSQS